MKASISIISVGLVLLAFSGLSACSAQPAMDQAAVGPVLSLDSMKMDSPEEKIAVLDILPLLNRSVPDQSGALASLSLSLLSPSSPGNP